MILGSPSEDWRKTLTKNENAIYVGVDRGALLLLKEGFPLDLAVGDFDSVSEDNQKFIFDHASEFVLKEDQDRTDFELALKIVAQKYPDQKIYLHNWKGGRLDHMISILYVAYQNEFQSILENLVMLHSDNTVKFYKPGRHLITKDVGKTYLSFINLETIKNLTLSEVKYPVENLNLQKPRALISNEFLRQEALLSFEEGLMMVIQTKDK